MNKLTKKTKFIIAIAISLLATGVLGIVFFNRPTKISEIKEVKVKETSKLSEKDLEVKERSLIFDETSKEASDGIKIVQGNYKINDVLQMADLSSFSSEANKNLPTREDAELQVKLSKPIKGIEGTDVKVEPADTVVANVKAFERGEEVLELSAASAKFIVGSKQGDEEFEKALVGMPMFKEVEKTIEYKKDYVRADLAGRKITYKITIGQIARPETPTKEEVDTVYQSLMQNAEYSNSYSQISAAKIHLRENSKVTAYPAKVIVQLQKEYEKMFFGEKYKNEEEFFEGSKANKNEYYAGRSEYVKSKIKDVLLLEALSAKTGITEDSQEFKQVDNALFTEVQKRDLLFELTLEKLLK